MAATIVLIIKLGHNGAVKGSFGTHAYASEMTQDIFISEVNYAGSLKSDNCKVTDTKFNCTFDKWVELFNPGKQILQLDSYSLLVGPDQKELHLSGEINPGQHFVIKNKNSSLNTALSNFDLEIGFLQNLSSKDNHLVNLALKKGDIIIDNKSFSSGKFDPKQDSDSRYSVEFEGAFRAGTIAQQTYFQDTGLSNFGTPGAGFIIPNVAPAILIKVPMSLFVPPLIVDTVSPNPAPILDSLPSIAAAKIPTPTHIESTLKSYETNNIPIQNLELKPEIIRSLEPLKTINLKNVELEAIFAKHYPILQKQNYSSSNLQTTNYSNISPDISSTIRLPNFNNVLTKIVFALTLSLSANYLFNRFKADFRECRLNLTKYCKLPT